MTEQAPPRNRGRFSRLRGEWLTISFVLLGIAFAIGTKNFTGNAVLFPLAVGLSAAALGLAELVRVLLFEKDPAEESDPIDESTNSARIFSSAESTELLIWCWFVGTLVLVYPLGIIVSSGISTAIYAVIFLRISLLRSALWGIILAFFIWLVFSELAGFHLYLGMLW